MWLPPVVPATFSYDTGKCGIKVYYAFEAKVSTTKKTERDKHERFPIQVLQRYVPPQSGVLTKDMKFAFQKETPVKIRAWMESQELFPGCDNKISISVDNQSKKDIKRCDFVLQGYIQARAGGYTRGGYVTGLKINAKKVGGLVPVLKGEKKEATFEFTVPGRLQCSTYLPKGFMRWYISANLKYGLKKTSIRIPVIVQPLTPKHLASFPCIPVLHTAAKVKHVKLDVRDDYTDPNLLYPWYSFLPCVPKKTLFKKLSRRK